MLKSVILVGCGGFIGSALRYVFNRLTLSIACTAFPLATFAVNIIGCFLIGALSALVQKHNVLNGNCNLFLVTGLCGGFTTFSTFANEVFNLSTKGELLASCLYLCASIIIGILCVALGRLIFS